MMERKQGIFGITSIEAPAHAPHQRNDLLPRSQPAVGGIGDLSDAFDPRNDRLLYIVVLDLKFAEDLFRMIHTEGPHPYEHPSRPDLRYPDLGQTDVLPGRRSVEHNGPHDFIYRRRSFIVLPSTGYITRFLHTEVCIPTNAGRSDGFSGESSSLVSVAQHCGSSA